MEMKLQILEEFRDWVKNHKDPMLKSKIAGRLNRMRHGNFGDCHSLGGGISELRIHCGPGYRIYYTIRGCVVVVLLCGGDKSSQRRDIARAKELSKEV